LNKDGLQAALDRADANLEASLDRLMALLRIPSISTDPVHAGDCRAAAQWLASELTGLGFEASVRDTPGHPMVVGHNRSGTGPNVLFYGHYDVQPADPIELWATDPFEPRIVETPAGRVIAARGASDDKGQLMTFVEACRAIRDSASELPVGVSVLFEGEEESGSPSLDGFLREAGAELKSDVALVCDTDMWDAETPSIVTMLRGLVGEEIVLTCASRDLHSGMYGGAARNPLRVLASILASLHASDGSVAIEGFYDDVRELPEETARQWAELGFDAEGYLGDVGLTTPAGEAGRSTLEQITSRPTCEINGAIGGYTGNGFKTVIPAKASAKISFRLVADQDPERVRTAFRQHVRNLLPPDCTVEFHEHGAAPAIRVPADGEFLALARSALREEWGKDAVVAGSGGSIPVVGSFKSQLGMDSLLIGFAGAGDNIHSPNEKYDLKSFHKGIRSWVRVLAAFGA
jgi:acetylornithine deacetylase/succinyl-diaminopimelate desuccinylase-like protein